MKVRLGFVTNSSSSSFIIARRPTLSQAQKDAIVNVVVRYLFGEPLTLEEAKEYCVDDYLDEDQIQEILATIQKDQSKGMIITGSCLDTDCYPEGDYYDLIRDIWKALEVVDPDGFDPIKADLPR